MNSYIVSVSIKGKTISIPVTMDIKAKDKGDAVEKVKKILTDDGFTYDGLDYCDWTGE